MLVEIVGWIIIVMIIIIIMMMIIIIIIEKESVMYSGGFWLVFKSRIEFMCGRKLFFMWWLVNSFVVRIIFWYKLKL